jgi:hypothetical protein
VESNLTKCKVCGELKQKIDLGFYEGKKDKKYVDENNKRWNGKQCPSCHNNRVRTDKRNKREVTI